MMLQRLNQKIFYHFFSMILMLMLLWYKMAADTFFVSLSFNCYNWRYVESEDIYWLRFSFSYCQNQETKLVYEKLPIIYKNVKTLLKNLALIGRIFCVRCSESLVFLKCKVKNCFFQSFVLLRD